MSPRRRRFMSRHNICGRSACAARTLCLATHHHAGRQSAHVPLGQLVCACNACQARLDCTAQWTIVVVGSCSCELLSIRCHQSFTRQTSRPAERHTTQTRVGYSWQRHSSFIRRHLLLTARVSAARQYAPSSNYCHVHRLSIITSAKEVMFYPACVCFFSVGKIT